MSDFDRDFDEDFDAVCWFRRDLRLHDNPAWAAASANGRVLALYVLDDGLIERAGPFRRAQFLAHLRGLDESLGAIGGRLHVRRGEPADVVPRLAAARGAAVYWNRDVSERATARDHAVAAALTSAGGLAPETFWGTLHHRPGSVLTGKGTLSQVFTPFYKRWITTPVDPWPDAQACTVVDHPGEAVPAGEPPPQPGGEAAADERLRTWLDRVDTYGETRDIPAIDGTSALSADLRFGVLSPRHVDEVVGAGSAGRDGFVRQLAWRDWYAHMTLARPDIADAAIRAKYDDIAWRDDPEGLAAWKLGHTGYPIVDAGMRQLKATGWMHNRVRMITGSFLVKDLLIDWRRGERHFRHLLIDGDIAQNAGNWQWVAGTGADAAPYFRIFNPTSQSKKFDPDGSYIRRWVPELAGLDTRMIHEPAAAPPLDLAAAGVVLGDTYPHPIVDHASARERCLTAYKAATNPEG